MPVQPGGPNERTSPVEPWWPGPFRHPVLADLPEPYPFIYLASEYQAKAMQIVLEYINDQLDTTDTEVRVLPQDIYVVWFCKTLQHWKCLISTILPDQMYYEVTYNGDKKEAYLDAYKKWKNKVIPDE